MLNMLCHYVALLGNPWHWHVMTMLCKEMQATFFDSLRLCPTQSASWFFSNQFARDQWQNASIPGILQNYLVRLELRAPKQGRDPMVWYIWYARNAGALMFTSGSQRFLKRCSGFVRNCLDMPRCMQFWAIQNIIVKLGCPCVDLWFVLGKKFWIWGYCGSWESFPEHSEKIKALCILLGGSGGSCWQAGLNLRPCRSYYESWSCIHVV